MTILAQLEIIETPLYDIEEERLANESKVIVKDYITNLFNR